MNPVEEFLETHSSIVNGIAIFEILLVYVFLSIIIIFGYDASLFF